jgi:2-polyprenyl-3-methyl-5-hydroxy-6-metoxy-1,4-benzoquinol methylase
MAHMGLIIFPVRSYGFQCEHGSWIMIPDLELAIVIASGEQRISDQHYAVRPEYERSFKVFSRQFVPSDRPLRILDIGCGTGLNARHLAAQGHSVVGLDLSPVAIEQFRANGFEGIVCDVANGVPLVDGSFDLVFTSEVIEHVADTGTFLSEAHRLLKDNGILVLTTPNSTFWPIRILSLLGYAASDYEHPGHVRFFSRRTLKAAIETAGFVIDKISGRHMYFLCGARIGDPLAPLLKLIGCATEPSFATGGHLWQLSRFARRASGFWADTFIVEARKVRRRVV